VLPLGVGGACGQRFTDGKARAIGDQLARRVTLRSQRAADPLVSGRKVALPLGVWRSWREAARQSRVQKFSLLHRDGVPEWMKERTG
jgi:hypothetical protein